MALLGQLRYIENPGALFHLSIQSSWYPYQKQRGRQTRSFCLLKALTGLTESGHSVLTERTVTTAVVKSNTAFDV